MGDVSTIAGAPGPAGQARGDQSGAAALVATLRAHWAVVAGLLLIGVPTVMRLANDVWTLEVGSHGPIVFATGFWLLWLSLRENAIAPAPPRVAAVALPLIPGAALYIFGRAYEFISLEAAGLYIIAVTALFAVLGGRALLKVYFPLFYLAFLLPPPGWLIDRITMPLREFVSYVSTEFLHMLGYPILRNGVAIMIAQYQLLVEDACSGMNSIVGLTATSLLYIYFLHRGERRYALFLLAMILPIAILTNCIRIVILILLAYYFGDGVAQGFMHQSTSFLMFAVALGLLFLIDECAQRLLAMRRRRTA